MHSSRSRAEYDVLVPRSRRFLGLPVSSEAVRDNPSRLATVRSRLAVEAIFAARHRPDGSFTGAGAIELGLNRGLVERLEIRLAELLARRRGVVAWYPAECPWSRPVHGLHD